MSSLVREEKEDTELAKETCGQRTQPLSQKPEKEVLSGWSTRSVFNIQSLDLLTKLFEVLVSLVSQKGGIITTLRGFKVAEG
jgi:hypothetical protein